MAKWLLVGDPHAVEEELDDCRALIQGVVEVVLKERPHYVLFMGDQHHNHKLINVEVMAFWQKAFRDITATGAIVWALVGNHDMPGDGVSKAHAMMAYQDIPNFFIVDQPQVVGRVLLMPYRHSNQEFIQDVLTRQQSVVFCHQTFEGSRYENGMYAPGGVPSDLMKDRHIFSGHIHTPQSFGMITYIGAPRWRTLGDVGVNRALALVDVPKDQPPAIVKLFDTSQWCRQLVHVVDAESEPVHPDLNPRWRYIVDIHGSEDYIRTRKALWTAPGVRIRTFKTREEVKAVRESMGISKALSVFMDTYKPRFGTEPLILRQMVNSRLGSL